LRRRRATGSLVRGPAALALLVAAAGCTGALQRAPQPSGPLGAGRTASPTEIAAVDHDVRPDGRGLPPGGATAADGQPVYEMRCAGCHGKSGTEGPADRLAGRQPADAFPFAEQPRERRTVGSYWPYATTLFDYIRRAMPPDTAGSLDDHEVYALTAYVLSLNGIVNRDERLDATTLPAVEMPARRRFVPDDRRGGPEVR